MTWQTVLVIVILVLILGSASLYLYKAKKRGVKCIGCPDSGSCGSGGCSGNCIGCNGSCGQKH